MKKNLLTIFSCLFFALFVASCSPVEETVKPANAITSSEGLIVTLEWTTGGSVTQAQADADLDLVLKKNTTEIRKSSSFGFDELFMEDVFGDGEYKLIVKAYEVTKKADYTIYVTDADREQTKTYTGYFNAGDDGIEVEYMTIKKSGSQYIITEL